MAPPPPRRKHPNLFAYHLMSCFLLLASTTAAASTYSSACTSPAPAADRHTDAGDALSLAGSFQLYNGHFSGGSEDGLFSLDDDPLHGSYRSFSLFPDRVARTSDPALVHLAATLELTGSRSRLHARGRNHTLGGALVSFVLDGYYSSASLELCMVGTLSAITTGLVADAAVVLRLRVPNPPRLADPFVTGILEGSSHLGAIRLLAYSRGDDYEYGDRGHAATCSPPAAPLVQSLGVGGNLPACAHLVDQLVTSYRLLPQDDHLGGGGTPAALPRRMHVNQMHCTSDGAVRAYVVFSNDTLRRGYDGSFMVEEAAAVAEGHWDTARGMLCLRACRVVRIVPPSTLAVQECGMRMSFWFPAVWTVRDRSVVAGMLWNTSNDAGANIMSAFSIDDPADYHRRNLSDVRYQYNSTMLDEARQHYLKTKKERKTIGGPFPVPGNHQDTYHDFSLHFLGRNGTGNGDVYPVSIGSVMMSEDALAAAAHDNDMVGTEHGLLSVSYDIHHYYAPPEHRERPPKNVSSSRRPHQAPLELRQRISAEGVYDPERGILCMVGCREHNGSTDCRVLVTVQLASLDVTEQEHGGGGGKGEISSLRDRADGLFFEKMDIALYGMYSVQLSDAVSRMDLESLLLVASTTLSCVFAAAQILHTKRNPEAAPATSLTMLAVLALGHLAPLALGFENLFVSRRSRYDLASSSGWLELNQAMMDVPTLVALALHLRLLQLAFSGRRRSVAAGQSKPVAASSERAVLKVCVPLYLLGAIVATAVHAAASKMDWPAAFWWEDLVSYAGLVVDGFLLPQIILNASSSRGGAARAISPWFYVGGTVVRMAPHAYDLVRRQAYVPSMRPSGLYASARGELFGVAWDVVVPCGAALLASILFCQQRRAGAGAGGGGGRTPLFGAS